MNGSVAFHAAVEAPRAFRVLGMSRARIEELAQARLAWLLAHAARIPFHRPHVERAGIDRSGGRVRSPLRVLQRFPLSDKRALLSAGEAALEYGRIRPEWHWSRSSGSTGEPFRVYYDARAWAVLKLLIKARSRWACGVRPWDRIVILDAISGEWRPSSRRVDRLRRVNVTTTETDEIALQMAAFGPDVVYGLPSVLLEVAGATRDPIRPRMIFTSGELLTAVPRSRLEKAYAAPVYDVYGSTETKEIAWECPEGSLHVNTDVVWVEIVDDEGNALPTGEEGRIVATVLVNAAMPLIRYVTGDRGAALAGGCTCGVALPRIGVVSGRETDYIVLGDRRVSPYRLTCALEGIQGIRRFQVVQRSDRHLGVRIEALSDVDRESLASRAREALVRIGPGRLTVSVDFVERLEKGPGGKFRVVEPLGNRG